MDYAQGPMVVLGGVAVSYERDTPVQCMRATSSSPPHVINQPLARSHRQGLLVNDPLGPSGSLSSQHRRTPEIVLEKGHAPFWITSSHPVQIIAAEQVKGVSSSGM